jgi:hypothetical protein
VDSTQISCKIPNDKVLVHLGFKSKVSLASWYYLIASPQAHSRVSNVNLDIGGGLYSNLL